MDDALLVGGGQPVRGLGGLVDGLAHRDRTGIEPRAQRLALEQLHDHEGRALVGAEVEDGADVGVVQRPGGAGFLLEALDALGVARPTRRG